MMLAVALLFGVTAAFAGASDQLKAILKADSYQDAKSLLEQNLNSLPSNDEKAKAYNYLVELSMKKYNKESAVVTQNQMNDQMKMSKNNQSYDTLGMYNAAANALKAAEECYKYDNMPNAKGKVSPKFASLSTTLWPIHIDLVNGGQYAAQHNNTDAVLMYWGAFLDSDSSPLFASIDEAKKKSEDQYRGQVARFAAVYAYQAKDMDAANKYCDIALKDTAEFKNAFNLKLVLMGDGLKNKEDSLGYASKLKELQTKYPDNDVILDKLYNVYASLGEKVQAKQVLTDALAKDPNNFVALADLGMAYISENDADNAIKYLRKACDLKPDNAVVQTYLGTVLNVKASNAVAKQTRDVIFEEAIKHLDKAKELDPNKNQANWGYNRYQAYYGRYGANDPKTQSAEADK